MCNEDQMAFNRSRVQVFKRIDVQAFRRLVFQIRDPRSAIRVHGEVYR